MKITKIRGALPREIQIRVAVSNVTCTSKVRITVTHGYSRDQVERMVVDGGLAIIENDDDEEPRSALIPKSIDVTGSRFNVYSTGHTSNIQ